MLVFRPGTYYVGGLVKQQSTIWQGAGRFATIIQLVNGANTDVVQGANFSTLTLTGATNAGIGGWGIRDLTLDGNYANQSGTSYGLRVYGYNYDLYNVSIRNCLNWGKYSEWGNFGGASVPDSTMEARSYGLNIHDCQQGGWHNRGPHDSRAFDLTIFKNSASFPGYWGEAEFSSGTTVAAGSNGVNVSTFAGAGVLHVNTTLGYPSASINATQGSLTVATSGTSAVITYTGVTAQTFTGCTTVSGNGTLSTGGAIVPTGNPYSASGTQLHGAHVWGNSQWCYQLDTETQLNGCISDVGATGNTGMILIRSGGGARVVGGYHYALAGSTGCGIQLGDAVNQCQQAFIDTDILGLTGGSAALASVSIVNDGGQNMVRASVNQAANAPTFGTANVESLYEVFLTGQAQSPTAIQQSVGIQQFIDWMPSDNGLLLASGDPVVFSTDKTSLTSGTVYLIKLVARQTVTIGNLWVNNAEAASGSTTGSFAGLYSSAGVLLTGSSDIASLFSGGFSTVEIPLTTPQTIAAGTFVWAALLFNLSVTNPGLLGGTGNVASAGSAGLTVASARYATVSGGSRTSLPASFTPSACSFSTGTVWVGAS
jgi:hypothetical protein